MPGSDLSQKIEEVVRRAVTSVVEDINASLTDVRDAVNQQFEAAVQSVMADAQAVSISDELQSLLADHQSDGGAPSTTPPTAQTSRPGPDISELKRAIQEVERGTSQVEVLNAMLEQALRFSTRAALLVLKGDAFSGWKGRGFSEHGNDDELIKRVTLEPGALTELDQLRQNEKGTLWDGSSFAARTSVAPPQKALLIPMVIKDKVAAALYADQMSEGTELDRASLELLVFTTGLLVDTLAIRKKIPSPTLSPESGDRDPFQEEESQEPELAIEPQPAPAPQSQPEPAPAPQPEPEAPSAPEVVTQVAAPSGFGQPEPASPAQVSPPASAPPQAPPAMEIPGPTPSAEAPSAQVQPPTQVSPPAPASPPQAAPSSAPDQPSTEVKPPSAAPQEGSTQYVPPPELKKEAPGIGAQGAGDTRKHDDAKRFARLLVSEIKLYNEGKVDQGRKNRDLYERLKEDIDRSRQMYEERVDESVRAVTNYFYDELVRILADGDSDALGL